MNLQIFTTPLDASWTKPDGLVMIYLCGFGGGSGGGSGTRNASGTTRNGGNAGAGGAFTNMVIYPEAIPNTCQVMVGYGGLGAPGITTNTTSGILGGSGGDTIFGYGLFLAGGGVTAGGGSSGGAGVINGTAGSPGFNDPVLAGTSTSLIGATGGGGGGGINTSNVTRSGGNGGAVTVGSRYTAISAAAGAAANAGDGADGTSCSADFLGGLGGGGGGPGTTTAAGRGGHGGLYGGGGGGGGGSLNGFNSGAGGNGGDGVLVVAAFTGVVSDEVRDGARSLSFMPGVTFVE